MKKLGATLGRLFVAKAAMFACPAFAADSMPLALEAKISLGDVTGRIDHLAYDPARQRLYVAELGNDSVGIVDLGMKRLLRTVSGFDEPQGIAYEPLTDTVYVANGGDGSVRLHRGEDFASIGQISLGGDADNVRVDRAAHRVYVGYGDGAIAVIDPITRKKIGNIALRGHPESFQLEPSGPRIFVNVPDAGAIAVASRETGAQMTSWPTSKLRANYPMALDVPNKRVLIVFRHPARMEAFDIMTGAVRSGIDTCDDADDVFVDEKRDRVYVICGDGGVDTYSPAGKSFTRVGRLATRAGARTGLHLTELDRLAVAIRANSGEPAELWVLRPTP